MNVSIKRMGTIDYIMSKRQELYPRRWVKKEVIAIVEEAEKYAPNQVSIFRATCVRPTNKIQLS